MILRKIFSAARQWFAQYKRENILCMIQQTYYTTQNVQGTVCVWIAGAILFSKAVYEAVSYDDQGTYVGIALLMMMTFCHKTGTGVYMAMIVLLGITAGCCINMIIMAITYAVSGGFLSPSGDSAATYAVFIVLLSFTMGTISAVRWQYESLDFLLFKITIAIIFTGVLNDVKRVSFVAPWFILAQVCVSVVVFVLCVFFVFPVTSASKYRLCLRNVMHHASCAINQTSKLLMEPLESESGVPKIASGQVDHATGWDTGLKDTIMKIRDHIKTSRSLISSFLSLNLNLEVWIELDVYCKPHVFPHVQMQQTKLALWNSVRSIAFLVRRLQSGHENLSFLTDPSFRLPVQNLMGSMSDLLNALGEAIVDLHPDKSGSFEKADACLQLFDSHWNVLMDNLTKTFFASETSMLTADERKTSGMLNLLTTLYLLGRKLRMLYETESLALHGRSNKAMAIAAARFEYQNTWKRPSEAIAQAPIRQSHTESMKRSGTFLQLQEIANQKPISLIMPNSQWHSKNHDRPALLHFRFMIGGLRRSSSPKRLYRYVPLWLLLFGQMAICTAIGTTFSVIPVIVNNAFNGSGMALMATIFAVYMPSIGFIELRMLHRFLGTLAGSVASYVIVGVAYLVNGLSWENHPAKIIMVVFLLGIWCGFLNGTALRYPASKYAFLVSAFTVAIIIGPSLYSTKPPWKPVAYRVLETIVGMSIVTLGAMILPISVYSQVKSSISESLDRLAKLVRTIPNHLKPVESLGKQFIHMHKTDPETFEAYYNHCNATPIESAIRIERCLSRIQSMYAAIDLEYSTLKNFPQGKKRMPKSSAVSNVKEAIQACTSFSTLMYDIKIENSPDGPMPVPEWLLYHIEKITWAMAECLVELKECMHGKKKVVHAMEQISILDAALIEQLKDCLLSDELHSLSIPMVMMLYIGLGFSQQIRFMWKTCIKALLLDCDEDESALIEKKAAQQSALGPDVWIENVLALALH